MGAVEVAGVVESTVDEVAADIVAGAMLEVGAAAAEEEVAGIADLWLLVFEQVVEGRKALFEAQKKESD